MAPLVHSPTNLASMFVLACCSKLHIYILIKYLWLPQVCSKLRESNITGNLHQWRIYMIRVTTLSAEEIGNWQAIYIYTSRHEQEAITT